MPSFAFDTLWTGLHEFHPIRRRGVRRTGWFLIAQWQTQSDGVDLPKTAPRFFRLPRRGIGMGQTEMPHSFQRRYLA